MSFFKELNVSYEYENKEICSGRETLLKNEYWHQKLTFSHIDKIKKNNHQTIGIIGYACDAGVKRNQGRVGARKGPKSIRKKLGKIPIHFENKKIIDFGDVICINDDLEDCQKAFSKIISRLIKFNIFPIAIGGGHDIAFANFCGIKDAIKNKSKKIGIINFDAHFDLRVVEKKSNSGTPFNQILNEYNDSSYFAIGIQKQSNSKQLFEIAEKRKVLYSSNFECDKFGLKVKDKLSYFIEKMDYLYVTIDMDGFSSAYAPGVSAPSPIGFSPYFIFQALEFILKSNKVISFDIAELNPEYDADEKTADLAARLIDFIVNKLSFD